MSHLPLHTTITKYSHYFTVRNPTRNILPLIYQLSSNYTQTGLVYDKHTRKKRWAPLKTFGIYVDHGREYRFHIGQFKEFMSMVERAYVEPSSYEVIETPLYEPDKIELKVRPGWELYPEQVAAKDFIVENDVPEDRFTLLGMPTGTGKGTTSMFALAEIGQRFTVRVSVSDYLEKWIKELTEVLELDRSEICVIKGSDSLMRATNYPASGLPIPKAFVIMTQTMSQWFKLYEEDMNNPLLEAYACMPYDFCQHLGIGVDIYEEAHQQPHAIYRSFTYTHVPKTIALTATLLTKDPVLRKVQSMMFPHFKRFEKIKMKKYITVHACAYQIMDYIRSKVRTSEWGQNSYSHVAFERSLLSHRTLRQQYLKMISDLADRTYYQNKVEGDKLLIFVSTKIMAETLVHHLKHKWPELDIRKYLQENELSDILDPDICVSTVLSGGTAIDIHGLRHVIQTINLDSPNANAQSLGRLREMKYRQVNNDVHFHYLYCTTIPKHIEYHENRRELFADRALEQKLEFVGTLFP